MTTYASLVEEWVKTEQEKQQEETDICDSIESKNENETDNNINIIKTYLDENYEILYNITEYMKEKYESLGLMTDITYINIMHLLEETMLVKIKEIDN